MSSLQAVYTLFDVKDNNITINFTREDVAENGNTICLSSSIDLEATEVADFDIEDAEDSMVKAVEAVKAYAEENNLALVTETPQDFVLHSNNELAY